jgi:DeoR/GlpR family transcriptional regulator of sugar metabolism
VTALAPQRQQRILEEVRRRGGVRVSDLVDLLGVSDMTIRRDLDVLARRGLLHKVHGGATASIDHATDEPGFAAKSGRELQEKTAMARAAAELVEPGTAVGLSAGTTTWALARFLVSVPRLTVVTNSIPVAEVFYASGGTDQTVVLTGGVRTPSDALVGPVAMNTLRSLHLDQLFMGVHGMDLVRGYTTPNLVEAETNRALIDSSRQLVILADHTKWGVVGLSTFATLEETHVLITDSRLPVPVQELLAERVHRLVLTDADEDAQADADVGPGPRALAAEARG